ncbi:MAG: Rieske 2Fe-2S domain-containing protein [Alteromonadaceae bacterium]|nr:Rieske 2Fe-2S domain-containing protein [Alteromonadaceae bacterium]
MPIIKFSTHDLPLVLKTKHKYIEVKTNDAGGCFITDMTCKHRGGPLTHGVDLGDSIMCPWHKTKTRKCMIKHTNTPYIVNELKVSIMLPEFERFIKIN